MKKILVPLALVAAVVFANGCTNPEGETEAPVFITVNIDFLSSPA